MKDTARKAKLSAKIERDKRLTRYFLFILFGLFILVAGVLAFIHSTQPLSNVWSLNDNWNSLEKSAHNLQDEAYLTNVTISLDRDAPFIITAEFHSISVSDKMIFVGINHSNEVSAKWVNLPPSGSAAQKPIYRSDWTIDSRNAFSMFAKDETVNACLESSRSSIDLSLNRILTENPSWVLNISDCPEEGTYEDFYLDAKTGESIDPFIQ